jgi:hypothetical protein
MVKRLSTLVVVALAGGCVDAKGAYDDYATRVVDGGVDAPPSSTCPSPGGAADFSGTFLVGAVGQVGQSADILFLLTVTHRPSEGGVGASTADFSMQPLTFDTKMPTGAAIPSNNVAVDDCGNFAMPLVGLLPGDADPVAPGVALELDTLFTGGVFSTNFLCGQLSGTANGSIPVAGGFAMERVDTTMPLPASKNSCAAGGF